MERRRNFKFTAYPMWSLLLTAPVAVSSMPAASENNWKRQSLESAVDAALNLSGQVGADPSATVSGFAASAIFSSPSATSSAESDSDGPDSDDEPESDDEDDESRLDDPRRKMEPPPPTGTSPPRTGLQASETGSTVTAAAAAQSGGETAERMMIAGGAVGAFIVIAFIAFAFIRWRRSMAKKLLPKSFRKEKTLPTPPHTFAERHQTMTERHPSTLFGGGSSNRPGPARGDPLLEMPFPPPPVLVPSDGSLYRRESRPNLVRNSLLRRAQTTSSDDGRTFYLEDEVQEEDSARIDPPQYTKSPQNPQPMARVNSMTENFALVANRNPSDTFQGFMFPPPPIPDSPQAAAEVSRFSWTTNPNQPEASARSIRSSVDSAPKFREVGSWVENQAARHERSAKPARLSLGRGPEEMTRAGSVPGVGSVPSTPSAFRHHPGKPVTFVAKHGRMESSDLDRQLMNTRGSEYAGAEK